MFKSDRNLNLRGQILEFPGWLLYILDKSTFIEIPVKSSSSSVSDWLEQVRNLNEDASIKLWNRYFEQLASLARRKLGAKPLRVIDEGDIANQAFEDLLAGIRDGRFQKLDDRGDLWALLVTITERRSTDAKRKWNRQKRGGGQVRGDSAMGNFSGADFDQFAAEPTVEFSLESRENLDRLLTKLPSDEHRQMALLKLKGFANQEIARELDVSVPTVERRLRAIRDYWEGDI